MALVWNPTTSRVIPQYHVVFDDDFTTVQYTEAGTVPLNWKDLVTNSPEKATPNNVYLSNSWMNDLPGVEALDHIPDLFAIVSDQHKRHNQQSQGSASRKPIYTSVSEGDSSQPPYHTEQGSQAEDNSILTARSQPQSGIEGVQRYTFESNPTLNQNSHNADKEALKMPIRQNPRKNGLHWSPCLHEKREQE